VVAAGGICDGEDVEALSQKKLVKGTIKTHPAWYRPAGFFKVLFQYVAS
jgi:hypothetical protein